MRRDGFYHLQHDGTEHRLPSVTTILSAVAKPALVTWAAKQAARAALQDPTITAEQAVGAVYGQRDSAGDRGSLIHSYTEAVDNGHRPDVVPPNVQPYAEAFDKFHAAFRPKLVLNECMVFNLTHGYAGTLDRLYNMGDVNVLVDLKTSKAYYPEMGLQLVAYKNAEFRRYGETSASMLPVDRMMTVLLSDDGTFTAKDCDEPFEVFLHYFECWKWQNADKLERMKIPEAKKNGKADNRVRPAQHGDRAADRPPVSSGTFRGRPRRAPRRRVERAS